MAQFKTIDELDVFGQAENLADSVWDVVIAWNHFAQNTVGTQLVRAADSVGANLAEGHASGSFAEFKRFAGYSRRSLAEVPFFLRRAHKRKLLDAKTSPELQQMLAELQPRLGAFVKYLSRRAADQKKKRPPINKSTDQLGSA